MIAFFTFFLSLSLILLNPLAFGSDDADGLWSELDQFKVVNEEHKDEVSQKESAVIKEDVITEEPVKFRDKKKWRQSSTSFETTSQMDQ